MRINNINSYSWKNCPYIKNSRLSFQGNDVESQNCHTFPKVSSNKIKAFFYCPSKNKNDNPILLDKNSGEIVKGKIFHPSKNTYYLDVNGKNSGLMFSSVCSSSIYGDKYPDYYKNKPYMFINLLESKDKYKGVGTELIKRLVRDSNKRGFDGHVCLNTTTINPTKGSPIPFYLNFGFECSDSEKQSIIEKCIAQNIEIPNSCTGVTMFLPQHKINEILRR